VGVIDAVEPAADRIARWGEKYRAARDELAARVA
jgi:hypothetical protein